MGVSGGEWGGGGGGGGGGRRGGGCLASPSFTGTSVSVSELGLFETKTVTDIHRGNLLSSEGSEVGPRGGFGIPKRGVLKLRSREGPVCHLVFWAGLGVREEGRLMGVHECVQGEGE